jgi:hypothetical protein
MLTDDLKMCTVETQFLEPAVKPQEIFKNKGGPLLLDPFKEC